MIGRVKSQMRSAVPLAARMRAAAWLTRHGWLPVRDHVAIGLVRDLLDTDPKAFHKFLWSNHFMGYARWYDAEHELFARERMEPSRIELFRDLLAVLGEIGAAPSAIRSVLEVGCSQGYLLRYLETDVFPAASDVVGIDIDAPAIEKGQRYLQHLGSRVKLVAGDMEDLEALVGEGKFDITIAAGVLSYLNEADATTMMARMLRRTATMIVLAGLACVDRNNSSLDRSELSPTHPGQWLHNFDAMVAKAGGRVVRSRWEGGKQYNFQTIAFTFAVPA